MTFRSATVRFRRAGWHHWPTPTANRSYLGGKHRHVFHVEVSMPLLHDNREVEFHDLLDFAKQAWGPDDQHFGSLSCEMLAEQLGRKVQDRYPGRMVEVSVFEDGEVGATVQIGKDG